MEKTLLRSIDGSENWAPEDDDSDSRINDDPADVSLSDYREIRKAIAPNKNNKAS